MKTAPIILFVYNRPDQLRNLLDSLIKNELSERSKLIVYSDGPKNESDEKKIRSVRNIIKNFKWPYSLEIIENNENKGLVNSIINGVTKVLNIYEKVIVLEDDLYLGSGFLSFINQGLNIYQEEERVAGVTGYLKWENLDINFPNSFFLNFGSSWGWGTWSSIWNDFQHYDFSKIQEEIKSVETNSQFNLGRNFYEILKRSLDGKVSSWAIYFYAYNFIHNNLFLFPGKNMVSHMGYDSRATNHGEKLNFKANVYNSKIDISDLPIKENKEIRNRIELASNIIT